jgi:hypothetical protein
MSQKNIELSVVSIEDPVITSAPNVSAHQTLTWFEMTVDGIKAVKTAFDPLSDAIACLAGTLCCVATAVAQAEENSKPATRGDVLYANQRRRNDAAEMGCAFQMGACLGDVVIDSTSIVLGSVLGAARASAFLFFSDKNRENTVFGFSRERIDNTDLFSSCRPVTSCCGDDEDSSFSTMNRV